MELQILLEDYDAKLQQYERVMQVVENLCSQIPAVAELLKICLLYTSHPCGHGVIAELGQEGGRTILLRADMDALPSCAVPPAPPLSAASTAFGAACTAD